MYRMSLRPGISVGFCLLTEILTFVKLLCATNPDKISWAIPLVKNTEIPGQCTGKTGKFCLLTTQKLSKCFWNSARLLVSCQKCQIPMSIAMTCITCNVIQSLVDWYYFWFTAFSVSGLFLVRDKVFTLSHFYKCYCWWRFAAFYQLDNLDNSWLCRWPLISIGKHTINE